MGLTVRENFLRNASFRGHEWIPQFCGISQAYWHEAREEIEEVCLRHPVLFPNFRKGQVNFDAGERNAAQREEVDAWGCRWRYELDGLAGIVTGHPLESWDSLETWTPPEPPAPQADLQERFEAAKNQGQVAGFSTEHGFLFMRLGYLRGLENFLCDVAAEDPRLERLMEVVVRYWERGIRAAIEAGLDALNAADDLGTQSASVLGPVHFRRWIQPAYRRLFLPVREAGAHVALHHDGFVMDIMDDIIASGVSIVNPQDLVNGIDNLAREVKGRVCICIDIDRQRILPFGSPSDVRDLVKEEVMKLGSPAGGLEMIVGIYPPTPPRNVDALFSALEEFRTYWVGR